MYDISGAPALAVLAPDGSRRAKQGAKFAMKAEDCPWQHEAAIEGLEPAPLQLAAIIGLLAMWAVSGASLL